MGQNTALKTRRLKKRGQPQKKKGVERIRLKAQKEDFNKKLHETPKGVEIYM